MRLARLLRSAGAVFILNDHADIAAAVDADGVHLGQDDLPIEYARKLLGPNKLIGISTHSQEQARAAQLSGADYIGFGPVFATRTKDAGPVQGIEKLRTICQGVIISVLAIGGISRKNVSEVIHSGADGVAVVSEILTATDIASASREMIRKIQKATNNGTTEGSA